MAERPTVQAGQIWKEVDPRFMRFVRVEDVRLGRRGVSIRTVISINGRWADAPYSRLSYADPERFNGKRGNYEFYEGARAALSAANGSGE